VEIFLEEDEFFDKLTDIVKSERKNRGISQLKLSNILGHNSTSYVARIELREGVNYNLSHLLKIAQEFDIDIKELIPNSKD
jgi:transcriptional regulator with XRE-family HTH domain